LRKQDSDESLGYGLGYGPLWKETMITKLFDAFFGCWHNHYSFPITVRRGSRRSAAASLTGTYVVCLDCGKEAPYDWKEMKVISSPSEQRHYAQSLATKQAA
jgi:hypothetical protein